jgi:hypothetical protein
VVLEDGSINDLGGQWARISMFESLSEACGQTMPAKQARTTGFKRGSGL